MGMIGGIRIGRGRAICELLDLFSGICSLREID